MEFPAHCLTNGVKIDGFSSINYRVFSLPHTNESMTDTDVPSRIHNSGCFPLHTRQTLRKLEIIYRERNILACLHPKHDEIWLFGADEQTSRLDEIIGAVTKIGGNAVVSMFGFECTELKGGILRASALETRPAAIRRIAASASGPASASEHSVRSAQAVNTKSVQLNASVKIPKSPILGAAAAGTKAQKPTSETLALYELFISAVVGAISYTLAKYHKYLPLDFRTFATPARQPSLGAVNEADQGSPSAVQSIALETLDVRLTSTGTLVVSSKRLQQSALRQMPYTSARPKHTDLWLAPGGRMARFLGPALFSSLDEDSHPNESPTWRRGRARTRTVIKNKEESWKTDVRNWLRGHGIDDSPNDTDLWLRVQIQVHPSFTPAKENTTGNQSPNFAVKPRTILWPARLCFGKISLEDASLARGNPGIRSDTGLHGGLEWLVPPENGGVLDPLAFAEHWVAGQEEREQLIRSRTAAREVATISAEFALTNTQNQFPSPAAINALRINIQGDLQPASGFYPTPPDGVQSQGATAPSMPDAPGATPASVGDHSVYQSGDVKVDNVNSTEDQTMTESSTVDLDNQHGQRESGAFDVDNPSTANQKTSDEMFEELDEAMFGGNAVTEEDFSFFDEPDLDELGLGTGEQYPTSVAQIGALTSAEDPGIAPRSDSTEDYVGKRETEVFDEFATVDGGNKGDDGKSNKPMLDAKVDGHPVNQETSFESKDLGFVLEPAEHPGIEETIDATWRDPSLLSPPLSPVLVKKKLLPAEEISKSNSNSNTSMGKLDGRKKHVNYYIKTQNRQLSNFDAVAFNHTLSLTDHKYASDGRFWFLAKQGSMSGGGTDVADRDSQTAILPEIGLLTEGNKSLVDKPQGRATEVAKSPAQGNQSSVFTPASDEESSDSLVEESELDSEEQPVPFRKANRTDKQIKELGAGLKRKRDSNESEDDDDNNDNNNHDYDSDAALSLCRLLDLTVNALPGEGVPISKGSLSPDAAAVSIADYVEVPNNEQGSLFGLEGAQLVAVAQIMADQLISSTLQPIKYKTAADLLEEALESCHLTCPNHSQVTEATRDFFGNARQCDLQTFLAIEDLPPEAPLAKAPLRPVHRRASTNKVVSQDGVSAASAPGMFKLPSPHVRVQRAEAKMDILPSALPFWETFGLSPCSGPKDFTACCVFPKGQGVESAAASFVDRISTVYESCRLGSHTLAGYLNLWESGMIPVSLENFGRDELELETALQQFDNICRYLGQNLPDAPGTSPTYRNIIIYLINPFEHPNALVGLSAAFAGLFEKYHEYAGYQESQLNRIVLQIIPIDFVVCESSLVIPSQEAYLKLALEIYDRCSGSEDHTVFQSQLPRNAPSLALAKPVPKRIGFKLSSEPPTPLLHETPCLHIAYAQSIDGRWISAAWTDNQGSSQTSVSYCLGMKASSHPLRPFREVAEEIWKTTLDMKATKKVTWRVYIVKVGVMDRKEVDIWTGFAAQQSQPVATMILLTTDPNPTLSIQSPSLPLASNGFNPQTGTYTTPDATPQPSTLSPDQFGNTATPSAALSSITATSNANTPTDAPIDVDSDATLIDITDETWGLIPSHRLHNTRSLTDINPALVSGYLLKRASAHDQRPLANMSVNLLWVSGSQQQRPTAVLKEVLGMYRGLSTLARAKGVIDVSSTEPWHVAAARKAVAGLGWLM